MKRLFSLFFLSLFSVILSPAQAQDNHPDWTAWVYTPGNGIVTIVRPNQSVVVDFEVKLPESVSEYPTDVYVSPDSTLLAYVTDIEAEASFVIFEWVTDTLRTYTLPTTNKETVNIAFHTAAETIELGQLLYHPTWRIPLNVAEYPEREKHVAISYYDGEQWQLAVYDFEQDNPTFTAQVELDGDSIQLIDYRDETLFIRSDKTAYQLRISDNELEEIPFLAATSDISDYNYTTGDTLIVEDDTLYFYETNASEPIELYASDTESSLKHPRFVQNGAYIFILDSNMKVIDKTGAEILPMFGPPGDNISQVVSTPNGLLFVASLGFSIVGHLDTTEKDIRPGGDVLFSSDDSELQVIFIHSATS